MSNDSLTILENKCDLYAVVEECEETGETSVVNQCLSQEQAEILLTRCLNGGGDAYIQPQEELYPEQVTALTKLSLFVVVGRIAGTDDDSAMCVEAVDEYEARQLATKELQSMLSQDDIDQWGEPEEATIISGVETMESFILSPIRKAAA